MCSHTMLRRGFLSENSPEISESASLVQCLFGNLSKIRASRQYQSEFLSGTPLGNLLKLKALYSKNYVYIYIYMEVI